MRSTSRVLFIIFLVSLFGVAIYIQAQLLGDPNSTFNQTTRFTLGKYPVFRTIFRLHTPGDARAQYLANSGSIAITWLKPYSQNVDRQLIEKFGEEITRVTGREVNISFSGNLKEEPYKIEDLQSEQFGALVQKPAGDALALYFVRDYIPRPDSELSTVYRETSILISMDAHVNYQRDNGGDREEYLLFSLLHQFGKQLGLKTNQQRNCIMNPAAGIGRDSFIFGFHPPQHFCESEYKQIQEIKAKLKK